MVFFLIHVFSRQYFSTQFLSFVPFPLINFYFEKFKKAYCFTSPDSATVTTNVQNGPSEPYYGLYPWLPAGTEPRSIGEWNALANFTDLGYPAGSVYFWQERDYLDNPIGPLWQKVNSDGKKGQCVSKYIMDVIRANCQDTCGVTKPSKICKPSLCEDSEEEWRKLASIGLFELEQARFQGSAAGQIFEQNKLNLNCSAEAKIVETDWSNQYGPNGEYVGPTEIVRYESICENEYSRPYARESAVEAAAFATRTPTPITTRTTQNCIEFSRV